MSDEGDIKVVITIPHHVYDDEEKSKKVDEALRQIDEKLETVDKEIEMKVIWWLE